MTLRPRGWLEAFLIVAAPTGIAFGLLWKTLQDDSAQASTLTGLAFGAILGLVGAAKFKEERVVIPTSDAVASVQTIHDRLVELEFVLAAETPTFRAYETQSQGSFSLGAVSLPGLRRRARLKVEGSSITIVAPSDVVRAVAG